MSVMELGLSKLAWKYLLWAEALYLFPLLYIVVFTSRGWYQVECYYPYYLVTLGGFVIISFLSRRVREEAILAELFVVVPWMLRIVMEGFSEDLEKEYVFLVLMSIVLLTYCWSYWRWDKGRGKRILISLFAALAYPFVLEGVESYFWESILTGQSHVLDEGMVLLTGGILGCGLSVCRSRRMFVLVSGLVIASALCYSIYMVDFIKTKRVYGSYTGRTEKIIPVVIVDEYGCTMRLSDMGSGYIVCFIWNMKRDNFVDDFEEYYRAIGESKKCAFLLLATAPNGTMGLQEAWKKHRSQHWSVPVYGVEHSEELWKQIGVREWAELACVFKGDTLIYANTIEKVMDYMKKME